MKERTIEKCNCPSDDQAKELEQKFMGLFRVARARGLTFDQLKIAAIRCCETKLINLNSVQIRLLTEAIDIAGALEVSAGKYEASND